MTLDGVTQVRLNPRAGSLTVHYEPSRLSHDRLLLALEEAGCSNLSRISGAMPNKSKAGVRLGQALVGAIVNKAVERSAHRLVSVLL